MFCFNFFKKDLYSLFLWIGFNCVKAAEPLQEDQVPGSSWYSFDRTGKNVELSGSRVIYWF